jgi:SAM-dependent methyltransferase
VPSRRWKRGTPPVKSTILAGMGSVARIREAVRFVLPWHAEVAVVTEGQDDLLDLEGMRTWAFPGADAGGAFDNPTDGRTLLSALEEVRGQGAQFLLVPSTATRLLDEHQGLREHLRECRIVLEEPETCTIFALHPFEETYQAPDGLPLPSLEMMAYTTGLYDPPDYFYLSGLEDAGDAAKVLAANELSIDSFRAILDFGCGCGRVLRHWQDLAADIHGADYNPYVVDWCTKNLTFASFERTHPGRHLSYADGAFDFIFAFSVFTHLARDAQDFWLRELRRVLSPQGILLLTVHGGAEVHRLGPEERKRFDAGELVIWNPAYSGSSRCAAFHPERYIREKLAEEFVLVDLAPGAIRTQDAVLLRRGA